MNTTCTRVATGVLFCADCKWARPLPWWSVGGKWRFAKCDRPEGLTGSADLIHPRFSRDHSYCTTMRSLDHLCGNAGTYWEAKP